MISPRPSHWSALTALGAMVASLVFVPALRSQSTPPAEPTPLPDNLAEMQRVTEWSLLTTVRQWSGHRGSDGEMLTIYSTSSTSQRQSAEGVLALMTQGPAAMMRMNLPVPVPEQMRKAGQPMPDVPTRMEDVWGWGSLGRGELQINDRSREAHTHVGKAETRERLADGDMPVELSLKINFTKRTYTLTARGSQAPRLIDILKRQMVDSSPIEVVERTVDLDGQVTDRRSKKVVEISIKDQPLPTKGIVLEGRTRRIQNRIREEVSWRLEPKKKIPRLEFERADDTFLPEPNAVAGIRLHWDQGTPSEIVITLSTVTREPGTCLNSADQSTADDVAFASGQSSLTIHNTTATSKGPVRLVSLLTSDYAAYADITVSALFDKTWVVGKSAHDGSEVVALVPDEDKNQISDFWQSQVGAEGKAAEWDEDAIPKTATKKGDGLTLFDEYRGLFIAGGEHRRLDPRQMELVLLDPDKLFDPTLWRNVTGAGSVVIDASQHHGQVVNFNSRYASSQPKYALELLKVSGLSDPDRTAIGNYIWGQTTALAVADAPATCRVFVDRPRAELLDALLPRVQAALSNPSSREGVELYGYGYTAATLQRVERTLTNDAQMKRYLDRVIRHVVVHEIAHACDVEHHNAGKSSSPTDPETEKGVATCPMRNFSRLDKFYRLPMELLAGSSAPMPLGNGKLCTADDNCAGQFRLAPK